MPITINQHPPEVDTLGQVSRENFSIIPHSVIRSHELSAYSKVIFCALDARIGQKASQRVLQKTLAEDLGLSLKTIKRALQELIEAGLLVRHITGRSNRYELINASRNKGVFSDRSAQGISDRSEVSSLQINNSLINKQNTEPEKEGLKAVAVDEVKENFEKTALKVITAETGVFLQSNAKTRETCSRAERLGENPHTYGKKVAQHFLGEKSRKTIRSDSGFLIGVSMKAILEGDTPKEVLNQVPTPIPPRFNSQEFLTCEHGGEAGLLPNGLARCPSCRATQSKENFNREQLALDQVKAPEVDFFKQLERVS
jgi:DNA-binding transcriptional regulator YhcF (GntR family)